jgi:hypothetical protein
MQPLKSKPLSQYTKNIGLETTCPRSIYSDLVAGCPAKKAKNPCIYCFNEILEKKFNFTRSFEQGFKLKSLKEWLTTKRGRLGKLLEEIKVVRINANTDFYPELDQTYADQIAQFTKQDIKVIAITKQPLTKIPKTMEAIKTNGGIMQATLNFLESNLFEPYWQNIEERKEAIAKYQQIMPNNLVLRIAPIIIGISKPKAIVNWYKSVGGKRVIIHFLRKTTPKLKEIICKLNGKLPTIKEEFYTKEEMRPIIKELDGVELSICAEYELNKKYGRPNCCFI